MDIKQSKTQNIRDMILCHYLKKNKNKKAALKIWISKILNYFRELQLLGLGSPHSPAAFCHSCFPPHQAFPCPCIHCPLLYSLLRFWDCHYHHLKNCLYAKENNCICLHGGAMSRCYQLRWWFPILSWTIILADNSSTSVFSATMGKYILERALSVISL